MKSSRKPWAGARPWAAIVFVSLWATAGCRGSVGGAGAADGGSGGAASGGSGSGGSGGSTGTDGGSPQGTGGQSASGGRVGSGGQTATGGQMGTGTGGDAATGGQMGTGTGGDTATGGHAGMGGRSFTGGRSGAAGNTPPDGGIAAGGSTSADASAVDGPVDSSVSDGPRDLAPGDGIPDAGQPPGNLALGAKCEGAGGQLMGCVTGLLCCKPCCDGRAATCQKPVQNTAGIGVGQCPLPDLTVSLKGLQTHVGAGPMTFTTDSCAAKEMCVDKPGLRNTLHFEVTTPNIGTADLVLGDPQGKAGFVYAMCHDHYHFEGYALYQLLDANGNEVLAGKKRAFCLMDGDPEPGYPLTRRENIFYDCDNQGISAGWADTYFNGLECQYIDVTSIPTGHYKLRVTVNPQRLFTELNYDNNTAEVEVDIPAAGTSPMDACTGEMPGVNRECGWKKAQTLTCTAGRQVTVGCGDECQMGRATGSPMLRVCDGDNVCTHPGLGDNDGCSFHPLGPAFGARVTFTCPASGRYTVMTATAQSNATSTCEYAIR